MNILKRAALFVALTIASFVPQAFGVIDQAIAILNETNLVLSWPSKGYETYLVQYRPTLSEETPWLNLTNAFPANSTNRTTYVIPCCALVELAGTNGMSLMRAASNTESKSQSFDPDAPRLWVVLQDGKNLVPLSIYPHGISTNGMTLIEASWAEVMSNKSSKNGQKTESENEGGPEVMRISNGGCDCPDMGFFRVFHIPDWVLNITNYVHEGPTFLAVDFKDYRDLVTHIEVLVNGEPYPHADFMTYGGPTNWGMGIYFDHLTNGNYQIQLVTTLQLNDEIGDNSVFLALTNLTRSITVFNQVTFPDWNDFIQGDTYTFNAKLANPDTDWWIDIYDVQNNYVATGSGHTSNGQVSWTWDLLDWQSNNRDDFDSDPYFYSEITFNSGGGGGPGPMSLITRPTRPPIKGYPNRGEWLISFSDRWYSDAPYYPSDVQTKYLEAMTNTRGGPLLIGDTSYLYPLRFGTNVYTQAQREQTWTNLLEWIGDLYIRNFYFFGHGNAKSIGCDQHLYPSTNGPWTGGILTSRKSKSLLYSWQVQQKTKYNRYRFVFLDGCSTAAGDWPNAFNVSKTNHTIQFYENHPKHPRPSVFVGWNEVVGAGTDVNDSNDFRNNWMGIWANGSGFPSIKTALENANSIYGWLPPGTFNSKIRFYGYDDMKIRDYNGKGDWRWP
ncbi:MAG TPA: hypothetical protein VFZ59_26240 [Verrucomicrobiae bacterium]|nr:hypothetical protein [Verrucomicrobiae bacterium]